MRTFEKLLIALAAVFVCFAFSGCSSFEMDAESLMQPPSLNEEQAKLNSALTEVIGENYKLHYPSIGGTNSAFIFYDLDDDGAEEAITFYSVNDDNIRINILEKNKENWVSIYEAAGASGEVEIVRFIETAKDEHCLAVKWDQEVGIYRFENQRLETLYSAPCDGMSIVDINADGYDDIMTFSGGYVGSYSAALLFHSDEGLVAMDSVNISTPYSGIMASQNGFLMEDKPAYFVDSEIYEGVYVTEVFTVREGRLKRETLANYLPKEAKEDNGTGSVIIISEYGKRGIYARNTAVCCTDIDKDGIMEMPVEYREEAATSDNTEIFFIDYIKCGETKEESYSVWFGFADPEGEYRFELPEEWADTVDIQYNSGSEEYVFINIENGADILRIKAERVNEYRDRYDENYVLLGENGTMAYYVYAIAQKGDKFYLEPDTLKNRFEFT